MLKKVFSLVSEVIKSAGEVVGLLEFTSLLWMSS
jgi:hypothetical protein